MFEREDGPVEKVFTVKPPRVCGFIYGDAGDAGMRVWAQEQIFRKCSPWILGIWAQEKKYKIQIQWFQWLWSEIGHRQRVLTKCSPYVSKIIGTFLAKNAAVPKKEPAKGNNS